MSLPTRGHLTLSANIPEVMGGGGSPLKGLGFLDQACLFSLAITQFLPAPWPGDRWLWLQLGGRKRLLSCLHCSWLLTTAWSLQSPLFFCSHSGVPNVFPPAPVIPSALFFLSLQTKHHLSVIGRPLQRFCLQWTVIHTASCARVALLQDNGTSLQDRSETKTV